LKNKIVMPNKYLFTSKRSMEMKSFFFQGLLFFCLLTIITNGQNLLPQQAIENFKKSKGLMINPDDDLSMHEKSMSRDLPWQVSTGQRQDPTINPRVNNRKKKDIPKLNGSMYRPVVTIADSNIRYSYTYNQNGNELIWLEESLSDSTWVNFWRGSSSYDSNGNKIEYLFQIWMTDTWASQYRIINTYFDNGSLHSGLEERLTNTGWVNNWKYTYSYDQNGNWITRLDEKRIDDSWVNWIRWTYTYDNNENELTWLKEIWSNDTWVNDSRQTSTYDTVGNCITKLVETLWNNAWVNEGKWTLTYDNVGNMLTEQYETWTADAWVNYWKNIYTYDYLGNVITKQSETRMNNALEYLSKLYYTYDDNRNAIKGEAFDWVNGAWESRVGFFSFSYNSRADYYTISGKVVAITYELIVTNVSDNELSAKTYSLSQNYPNPFNPTTVIQYALPYESNVSISVYNTLGEVVKTFNEGAKQTGSYNVNFNGEGLSSGIYLYSINAVSIDGKQNFQATKKMILIK